MTDRPAGGGRVRTVFLGSGDFAVPALHAVAAHADLLLVGVVTAPPRPAGRRSVITPTPVGVLAATLGVPVLTPARLRSPDAIAAVLAIDPALAVLADYGQLVPVGLLDLPHGALNLHPSALPRWRGAAPIPAAILAGDESTAVTLMRMDTGLDTGPLVARVPVPLDGTEVATALEARLAEIAARLLAATIGPWLRGELPAAAQDEALATLTRPLRREDGRLDPSRPARELERQVRAYQPWPGSFLETDGERLVVTVASVAPAEPGDVAGAIVRSGIEPALATSDGRLVLAAVVPAGRRAMPGADWLRGRRSPA